MTETDLKYIRQSDIIPESMQNEQLTIVGAGAVGSSCAMAFAKTGFTDMRIFDFDTVELHNLPNQMFRYTDIGKPKVNAIRDIIKDFEGFNIRPINSRFNANRLNGSIIITIDNMDDRIKIWNKAKEQFDKIRLYIDARMGAEVLRLYTIIPPLTSDTGPYEETLYPSADALHLPCTAKATMYTATVLGGLIVNQAKKALMCMIDQDAPTPAFEIIYDLTSDTLITR